MKQAVLYENNLTKERWLVDNPNTVEQIEGVDYLIVRSPETGRVFKMKKDALKKVVDRVMKKK